MLLPVLPVLEHDQPDTFSRALLLVGNIFGQIYLRSIVKLIYVDQRGSPECSYHSIIEEEIILNFGFSKT